MPMDPHHRENIRKAILRKYERSITKDDAMKYIYETYYKEGGLGGETFANEYKQWKRLNVEDGQ